MPDPFQEKLAQVRRELIIEAAVEIIAEQGFQRTTIKQIAQKAGIADGTIYNYFKNKEAILFAIMERLTESEVREVHFAEAEQLDFETFISGYAAHRMNEIDRDFLILKAVMPETIINAELQQQLNDRVYTPAFAAAEGYIQHLIDQGMLTNIDPAIASRLFASPLLGLMMLRLLGDEHVTRHWTQYIDAAVQFLQHAFLPSDTQT